jgi:hypothetical protein
MLGWRRIGHYGNHEVPIREDQFGGGGIESKSRVEWLGKERYEESMK